MLISGSHSQVFMTESEHNCVDVGTAHSHPACRCMPQVVKPEICYPDIAASMPEGLSHIVRAHAFKYERVRRWHRMVNGEGVLGSTGSTLPLEEAFQAKFEYKSQTRCGALPTHSCAFGYYDRDVVCLFVSAELPDLECDGCEQVV